MVLEDDHYLFRLRAACARQPEWNGHQLEALSAVVEAARVALTIDAFLEATGGLKEVARAALLDRAWNTREIAMRWDDPWMARAAVLEYRAALLDEPVSEEASRLRDVSGEVQGASERLLLCLAEAPMTAEAWAEIKGCARLLRRVDGGWRARCRRRAGLGFAVVDDVPGLEHSRADWMAGLLRYEGVWPEVAPLEVAHARDVFDVCLERQAVWPDPELAALALEARVCVDGASTAIGREAVMLDETLRYRARAFAHQLEMARLLAPLRVAAIGVLKGREVRLEAAASPKVLRLLVENLRPRLGLTMNGLGAAAGEVGFDLLRLVNEMGPGRDTFIEGAIELYGGSCAGAEEREDADGDGGGGS